MVGAVGGAAQAERDAWVAALEAQILASLQGRVCTTYKEKYIYFNHIFFSTRNGLT